MATILKRDIPYVLILFFGVVMAITFFLKIPLLSEFAVEAQRLLVPISSAAFVVGGVSLLLYHAARVQRRTKDWQLSVVSIAVFFIFLVTSLAPGIEKIHTVAYTTIVGMVTEAMWGLIALFMVSMALRAFRVKNLETFLFTLSCVIVLIGNAPVGESAFPVAPPVLKWLMDIPTMAGMRAMTIGLGLGIIAYGIRVMWGYERAVIGEVRREAS